MNTVCSHNYSKVLQVIPQAFLSQLDCKFNLFIQQTVENYDCDFPLSCFASVFLNIIIIFFASWINSVYPNFLKVINFTMPNTLKHYVHRVGRTARAGKVGRSVSLVGESERKMLKEIVKKAKAPVKARVIPQGKSTMQQAHVYDEIKPTA